MYSSYALDKFFYILQCVAGDSYVKLIEIVDTVGSYPLLNLGSENNGHFLTLFSKLSRLLFYYIGKVGLFLYLPKFLII